MRDYIFRGKTETGKWVYGSLICVDGFFCIMQKDDGSNYDYPYLDNSTGCIDGYITPVNPYTVGQWTSLLDKNGTRIFEDDIIRDGYGRTKTVEFFNGRYYPFIAFPEYNCWDESECVVIGNVHDILKGDSK